MKRPLYRHLKDSAGSTFDPDSVKTSCKLSKSPLELNFVNLPQPLSRSLWRLYSRSPVPPQFPPDSSIPALFNPLASRLLVDLKLTVAGTVEGTVEVGKVCGGGIFTAQPLSTSLAATISIMI